MAQNEDSFVPGIGKIPTFRPQTVANLVTLSDPDGFIKSKQSLVDAHTEFRAAASIYFYRDRDTQENYDTLKQNRELLADRVQVFRNGVNEAKPLVSSALAAAKDSNSRRACRNALNSLNGFEPVCQALITNLERDLDQAIDIEKTRLAVAIPAPPGQSSSLVRRRESEEPAPESTDAPIASSSGSSKRPRLAPPGSTPLTAIGRKDTALSAGPQNAPGDPQSAWGSALPLFQNLPSSSDREGRERARSATQHSQAHASRVAIRVCAPSSRSRGSSQCD